MSFWPSVRQRVCVAEDTFFYSLSLSPPLHLKLKAIHHIYSLMAENCLYISCWADDFKSTLSYEVFPDRRRVSNRGLRHTANYCSRLKSSSVQKQNFDLSGQITVKQQVFESQTSAAIKVSYLVSTLLASSVSKWDATAFCFLQPHAEEWQTFRLFQWPQRYDCNSAKAWQ